jgi:hypothetical protein
MIECSCCKGLVAEIVEAPGTKQLVCARCLGVIRGMLGLWDVVVTGMTKRETQRPSAAIMADTSRN